MFRTIGIFLLGLTLSSGLYTSNDDVVELTASNFQSEVIDSDELWLVEFYAPWCGHCKSLAPHWKNAASNLKGAANVAAVNIKKNKMLAKSFNITKPGTILLFKNNKYAPSVYKDQFREAVVSFRSLWAIWSRVFAFRDFLTLFNEHWRKGVVHVGAVDMDAHQAVGGPYGIRGFPTIKIFGYDKSSPKDYNGGRDADAITDAAMKALREMVDEKRSGGKKKSSGGDGGRKSGGGSDDVVVLTDSNFRELVLESKETWLVEFFAPWCGHCKNLAPHWAAAATEIKEKTGGAVKLGALDATVHQATGSRYGIRGYPSIKIFRQNHKNEDPIDYEGGRDTSGIVNSAMEFFDENIEPPTIDELINAEVLDEKCGGQLCIIAFLPDIMDTGKAGRNDYIELMAKLGERFKKQKWGWAWTPATAQPELEKALQVGGFGYPAVVAMNKRKELYALHRGSFSEEGLGPFLNVLTYGRGKLNTYPLPDGKIPEIVTKDPWDGEDAPPVEVEDIDLSDFKWDDEL